jgi:hypothetical protein
MRRHLWQSTTLNSVLACTRKVSLIDCFFHAFDVASYQISVLTSANQIIRLITGPCRCTLALHPGSAP